MGYSKAPLDDGRDVVAHSIMSLVSNSLFWSPSFLVMGKSEGLDTLWHGHVTAVTVAPEYRRLGLAGKFMKELETVSDKIHNAYFVDLFVRSSNSIAISMYEKFGYALFRRVLNYYSGADSEDALGKAQQNYFMRA